MLKVKTYEADNGATAVSYYLSSKYPFPRWELTMYSNGSLRLIAPGMYLRSQTLTQSFAVAVKFFNFLIRLKTSHREIELTLTRLE
jgi:hypothetical protein